MTGWTLKSAPLQRPREESRRRPCGKFVAAILPLHQHLASPRRPDTPATAHHAARNRKTVRTRQTPRRIRSARLAVRLHLARAPTHLRLVLGTMQQRRGQVGVDTAARVASIGRAQHGSLTSRQRHRLGRTPAPVLSRSRCGCLFFFERQATGVVQPRRHSRLGLCILFASRC